MIHVTDHSPLLTNAEAACYLRLVEPDADADDVKRAVNNLHKLVRDGKLRPVKSGQSYTYARAELDRYVEDATESFEPQSNAH